MNFAKLKAIYWSFHGDLFSFEIHTYNRYMTAIRLENQ